MKHFYGLPQFRKMEVFFLVSGCNCKLHNLAPCPQLSIYCVLWVDLPFLYSSTSHTHIMHHLYSLSFLTLFIPLFTLVFFHWLEFYTRHGISHHSSLSLSALALKQSCLFLLISFIQLNLNISWAMLCDSYCKKHCVYRKEQAWFPNL